MRLVRSTPSATGPAVTPIPAGRRELLESVRYMGDRFGALGLRPVQLVRCLGLDVRADPSGAARVWFALETLQVTGSFKVRGALAALSALAKRSRARSSSPALKVVAASAGNHGAGVAFAARALGVEASIVVPRGVPDAKRSKIEAYGARIIVAERDSYDDAEALARSMAESQGAAFLSAYDDVDVVAGNGGSLGFEIARALGRCPDVVLCPLGGGGLATGLSWALAVAAQDEGASGRTQAPSAVWGVQTEVSPAMALSLERGAAVEHLGATGPTLAEGLEGGIAAAAFARARDAVAGVIVATEEDTARAMVYAYREMGLVVEGSAAVALTPLLAGLPADVLGLEPSLPGDRPGQKAVDLVVVLTGRNVDPARLSRVLAGHGGGGTMGHHG